MFFQSFLDNEDAFITFLVGSLTTVRNEWSNAMEDTQSKMVRRAGGRILGEPRDIPGIGLYVSLVDTEGNRVSMLQPRMLQK